MPVDAATTARARLDPAASQGVFRMLLDALAHPGRRYQLPAAAVGRAPAVLLPLLAVADIEVAVAVHPDPDDWAGALTVATGAPVVGPRDAEWVAFLEPPAATMLTRLDRGSADAPERGTRIVIAAASLTVPTRSDDTAASPTTVVVLQGPGVPDRLTLAVGGVEADVFAALAAANAEFPAGIDTWLVTAGGVVAGLPRSTRIDVRDAREPAR